MTDDIDTYQKSVDSQNLSNQGLKVMIGADTYFPLMNGSARFSNRLATNLSQRGHEVHIFAASDRPGDYYVEEDDHGFKVHRLRSHGVPTHESFRLSLPFQIKKDIAQAFDQINPDVVHIQSHFMIGKAILEEAKKRGLPIVATNHFMPENLDPFLPFPEWFKHIVSKRSWKDMGKVMRKADFVTTPTPLAADAMKKYAHLDDVYAVSNGIQSADYEIQPGEKIEKPDHSLMLFTGRLAVEKHIDDLISALTLTDPELDIHLEVVGHGEQRPALERLAEEKGVADRVKFLGAVSDEELRNAYIRADIFVMPSTAELQSLSTLEAMSASTPVILADSMALPHLVDQSNGYLFEPRNISDLSEKITRVFTAAPEERQKMGEASRKMVDKHSIDSTMEIFESFYGGKIPEKLKGK